MDEYFNIINRDGVIINATAAAEIVEKEQKGESSESIVDIIIKNQDKNGIENEEKSVIDILASTIKVLQKENKSIKTEHDALSEEKSKFDKESSRMQIELDTLSKEKNKYDKESSKVQKE